MNHSAFFNPWLTVRKWSGRFRVCALSLLLLTGCATQTTQRVEQPSGTETTASADVQALLMSAARAREPRATELTLRAAGLALDYNDVEQARIILDSITTDNPGLTRDYLYLKARLANADADPALALRILEDKRLIAVPLTNADQVMLGRIRADAYYLGRSYLASARERILIHNLLDAEAQDLNHELIFESLMELPVSTLSNQAEKAITSDLRGWLSLAAMTKQYENDPLQQLVELNRWKKAWSHHPAASRLPSSLKLLSQVVKEQPKVIALLLPLQGDLGPFGRAIRDGFLAAHYSVNTDMEIRVFDTVNEEIVDLVSRAQQEGAEIAVGPLERQHVDTLAKLTQLPIPVLALNRTLDVSINADLYQFGLAPEDEVRQVADQVFSEGKRNALVLYSQGDWGNRNFETFVDRWSALGGTIVDSAQYGNDRDYSDLIKGMLNVDESESRATDLRRIIGQQFEFTPRRRQDVDFVFMLANPDQARRLNPTLAFYYAEDIPVYATSHVHETGDSRLEGIDLNGIRFCDIPWKLAGSDGIQASIENTWPAAKSSLASFYALGVDSYRLFPRLQQLKEIPGARLFGTTGVLRLDENNVITRSLMWAQFNDGKANSVPMVLESTSD